jgi:hypothetical protein
MHGKKQLEKHALEAISHSGSILRADSQMTPLLKVFRVIVEKREMPRALLALCLTSIPAFILGLVANGFTGRLLGHDTASVVIAISWPLLFGLSFISRAGTAIHSKPADDKSPTIE